MGHLTIARIKGIKNKDLFIEELNKISIHKLEFEVEEFELKQSTLTKNESKYKTLETYNLI